MKRILVLVCLIYFSKAVYTKEHSQLVSEECLDCLCQLLTKCDLYRGCQNGDCGPFGVTMPFWEDAVGIQDQDGAKRNDPKLISEYEKCATDLICTTKAIQNYMELYKRDCNKDGVIDCLDFAAIHTQGPTGCLNQPFPEKKKNFMENCLEENMSGIYSVKMRELAELETVQQLQGDMSQCQYP
ncbi:invertebrate-type lysozyme 6-like isoform X1 [Macrosteles quadrilineatus]|uniref:invertebrate-type lysozyme 6-like isoform X1 n=1 Tax=Macrosteles quadrilineatus TaxID=74068 RepID=UPI0023E0BD3E|nr:invertebrate-type lysozyme 6-like isoform X1 [Macrosteles quadrilineatus]